MQKDKIIFFISRLYFLGCLLIFQMAMLAVLDNKQFAYIAFGFSILNIAMIAFSFGFNQFLMFQYSRQDYAISKLFGEIFPVYIIHFLVVLFLFLFFLNIYSKNYMNHGFLFVLIGFIFSCRDFINFPSIIKNDFKSVSISNIITGSIVLLLTLFFIIFPEISSFYALCYLILALFLSLIITDIKKRAKELSFYSIATKLQPIKTYKSVATFGVTIFLFTIYYQISNILLPLMENENIVSVFGVIYIILGIVYIFPNILFNQILLPKLFAIYKNESYKNYILYLNKNIKLFLYLGILFLILIFIISIGMDYFKILKPMENNYMLKNGIQIVSIGIIFRYIATVLSGDLIVQGRVRQKIVVQTITVFISLILSFSFIKYFSFFGACTAYSFTEFILLIGYYIAKKTF